MRGPLKSDKWYDEQGVEPPDHITHHGTDEVHLDKHPHKWVAVGNFLHCSQGLSGHGIPYDHMRKVLIGTSPEGAPIFRDLTLSDNVKHNNK